MQEFDYYVKTEGIDAAVQNAKASMLSDLGKHPETRESVETAGMFLLLPMHSRAEVQQFVDGFN